MLSCTRDDQRIVRFLLENGADVRKTNKDGWNAFHIAVRYPSK